MSIRDRMVPLLESAKDRKKVIFPRPYDSAYSRLPGRQKRKARKDYLRFREQGKTHSGTRTELDKERKDLGMSSRMAELKRRQERSKKAGYFHR